MVKRRRWSVYSIRLTMRGGAAVVKIASGLSWWQARQAAESLRWHDDYTAVAYIRKEVT